MKKHLQEGRTHKACTCILQAMFPMVLGQALFDAVKIKLEYKRSESYSVGRCGVLLLLGISSTPASRSTPESLLHILYGRRESCRCRRPALSSCLLTGNATRPKNIDGPLCCLHRLDAGVSRAPLALILFTEPLQQNAGGWWLLGVGF